MGHEFISCIPIMAVKVFISGSKVTDFFPPEPKETVSRADTTQFLQLEIGNWKHTNLFSVQC